MKNIVFVRTIFGYEYHTDADNPDNGVEQGTAFADLPDDWVCPLCGAEKGDFVEE